MGQLECAGETEQPSTEGVLYLWVKAEQTHIYEQTVNMQESQCWGGAERGETKVMGW